MLPSMGLPFPLVRELVNDKLKAEQCPVFVYVGGNIGRQASQELARYLHLVGRIVVQDRLETVASAAPVEGISLAAYDFFTPQPVQGAH